MSRFDDEDDELFDDTSELSEEDEDEDVFESLEYIDTCQLQTKKEIRAGIREYLRIYQKDYELRRISTEE